ncbi:MAG: J domain-containing protein [Ilumatobacteraceae bacterium]|nr:J domain-containing protein [Ilumatobacteraceae bacterium]
MTSQDPFLVLCIEREASADEIRQAWKKRARMVHPDVGGTDSAMQELNEALQSALELVGAPVSPKAVPPVLVRRERDVSSFTVDALPTECFEALLIVAGISGAISHDEPPYQLEFSLHDAEVAGALNGWCRCYLVPEAGATTVSLLVGTAESSDGISVEEVRDYLVANLNAIEWPN